MAIKINSTTKKAIGLVLGFLAVLLVFSFIQTQIILDRHVKMVNKEFSGKGILIIEKKYADKIGLPQKCSDYKITKNELGEEIYEFKVQVPEGAAFARENIFICNGQQLSVPQEHSALIVIQEKQKTN